MARSLWPQLMLVCGDVEASSRFYSRVFGFESGHGGDEYEMIMHDGETVLQLHDDDTEDHHGLLKAEGQPVGNGVLVWFEVTDFEDTVGRVREVGAEIVQDVHVNPNTGQSEIWFRDPDGYLVVAAGPAPHRTGTKAQRRVGSGAQFPLEPAVVIDSWLRPLEDDRTMSPISNNVEKFYIDGKWAEPSTSDRLEVINPATEQPVTSIAMGGTPMSTLRSQRPELPSRRSPLLRLRSGWRC